MTLLVHAIESVLVNMLKINYLVLMTYFMLHVLAVFKK